MSHSLFSQILRIAVVAAVAGVLPAAVALPFRARLPVGASIALAALGAGLGTMIGAHLAKSIARRAQTLTAGAMELTRGKLGAQVNVRGEDEIGRLAQVFNYASQQLLAYDAETRRLYESLEAAMLETMVLIANIIDSKDSFTQGHSQRVGDWASEIGRELNLPEMEVRHLLYGGLLHDVGKIGVIEPILVKKSALTPEERDAIRAHPAIGATIISSVGFLKPILPAVRNHHERFDGTGYPDRLKGEEIPLLARIVAVADTWDACTSYRPYQEALKSENALDLIEGMRGKALDPTIVDALARLIRRKRAGGERLSVADPGSPAA